MKKVIKILFFGCLLLMSGAMKLQAMDPSIQIIRANKYLDKLIKDYGELLDNPAARAVKEAEDRLSDAGEALEKAKGEQPEGGRTQEDVTRTILRADQDVEFAEGYLADVKKKYSYKGNVSEELRDFVERIQQQSEDVARLEREVAGLQREVEIEKEPEPSQEPTQPEPAKPKPKQVFQPEPEKNGNGLAEPQEVVVEVPEVEQPKKKDFLSKKLISIGAAAAAAIAAAGAIYAGLKWYQKGRIVKAIANYGLTLEMFSPLQKDAMAAAVLASSRLPGSMRYLRSIVQKRQLASDAITTEMMWGILAHLYYRKTTTIQDVQTLKELVV